MKRILVLLLGALAFMSSSTAAYDFYVGGKDGWAPSPKESYSSWASRNRFQVNDRLIFRYEKGKDSVLVVDKVAYDACNVTNPIVSYADGNSVIRFTRSGPFYFISGVSGQCEGRQQKLAVVVMATRNQTQPGAPPPAPPAAPSASAPVAWPPSTPALSMVPPHPSPSSSPLRAVVNNVGLIVQVSLALMAFVV